MNRGWDELIKAKLSLWIRRLSDQVGWCKEFVAVDREKAQQLMA